MLHMSPHNPSIEAVGKSIDARHVAAVVGAAFVLLGALLLVLVSPHKADAKSYAMPKVDIQAQLETDGSLHVIEQRTFEFDGDYSKLRWSFAQLPSSAEVKANGVRIIDLDEFDALQAGSGESEGANEEVQAEIESLTNSVSADGIIAGETEGNSATAANLEGVTTTLEQRAFDLSWRDDVVPNADCYSLDSPQKSIYVFFKETPHRIVVELDYTITEMAQVYDDVAEIYWQYLNSGWSQPTENLTCKLELPLPKGTTVTEGDNVKVWGHGPSDGTVDTSESGLITAMIPNAKAGEYAELRVLVPKTWLTNLSTKATKQHSGTLRSDTVSKEESSWTDKSKSQYVQRLYWEITVIAICVLLIIVAVVLYRRFGVEFEPDYKEEYYREIPAPELHPVIIGRLWRWNKRKASDLTAAIMHLAQIGCIRIERKPENKRTQSDYLLTRAVELDEVEGDIDKATMKLLFAVIARDGATLSLEEIRDSAKRHSTSLKEEMKAWHLMLREEVDKEDLFDSKSKSVSLLIAGAAAFMAALFIVCVCFGYDDSLVTLCLIATSACLGAIAYFTRRRTRKGNNIAARCKALRNWLRDFSALDDSVPNDPNTWGEFMVYAYQFDVAKKVLQQLSVTQPDLLKAGSGAGAISSAAPWWLVTIDGTSGSFDGSFVGDVLNSSIEGVCSDIFSASAKDDGGYFGGDRSGDDCEGGDRSDDHSSDRGVADRGGDDDRGGCGHSSDRGGVECGGSGSD